MDSQIKEKVAKIKMLISDVDGVLTDGTIYKSSTGEELKKFNVTDGSGAAMARAAELKIALISGRYSKATALRAKELKITDLYNGTLGKLEPYAELKKKNKLKDEQIAYLGDDIIDLPVMEKAGVPIAVANAVDIVKDAAVHITAKSGGDGAFREAIDWILTVQERYDDTLRIVRRKIFKNKK